GKRYVQKLRPDLRVLKEHFVEIPQSKQKQRVLWQFAFDPAVLRHHRRELRVAGHFGKVSQKMGGVKKENSEASLMRSALPQAGLMPPKRQVLTPRTMISKPVLGPSVMPR